MSSKYNSSNKTNDSNDIEVVPASPTKPKKRRGNPATSVEGMLADLPEDERRAVISQALNNNLMFYKMERVKSTSELQNRILEFFETCVDTGQVPTVEKMCLAIGYDRKTVWNWETERRASQLVQDSPLSVGDIIKKAKEILAGYDAEMAANGKMNAVLYFFRAKNYYGMQDKQELTIEPKQNDFKQMSPEELRASVPELLDSDIIDE